MEHTAETWTSVLDCRELKLQACWDTSRVPLSATKALDIGDWCMYNDGELRVILERKTLADLKASLRDGRWTEQKARILANRGSSMVVYAIEDPGCVPEDWKITCILASQLKSNILVIQTKNPEGTFSVIAKLWSKVSTGEWNNGACGIPDKGGSLSPPQFPTRAIKKKDNHDARAVWVSQLACIPRLSLAIAAKVVEAYATPREFMERATLKDLAALQVTDKKKLGPKLAAALMDHFGEGPAPSPAHSDCPSR